MALLSQSLLLSSPRNEHTRTNKNGLLQAACFSAVTRLGMKPWTDFPEADAVTVTHQLIWTVEEPQFIWL